MRPCPSPVHLVNRLRNLALTSPPQTALFYARLWHALVPPTSDDHECLHILALCHLQVGNTYTALGYVRDLVDPISDRADHTLVQGHRSSQGCFACALIVGKCCDMLGRYGEGKEVLERALKRSAPTGKSLSTNITLNPADARPASHGARFNISGSLLDDGFSVPERQSSRAGGRGVCPSTRGGSVVVGGVHRSLRYRSVLLDRAEVWV